MTNSFMLKAFSKKGSNNAMKNPITTKTKGNTKKSFSELKYDVNILHSSFRWSINKLFMGYHQVNKNIFEGFFF